MGILFGDPKPPQFTDPLAFYEGIVVGFFILLIVTYLVDKLGNSMFDKGFAKPFYIKGHRIHHVTIYLIALPIYVVISVLILLGYVQMVWNEMYLRVAFTTVVAAVCIAADLLIDRRWPTVRKNVILHHEWMYLAVPFYVVMFVINITI